MNETSNNKRSIVEIKDITAGVGLSDFWDMECQESSLVWRMQELSRLDL